MNLDRHVATCSKELILLKIGLTRTAHSNDSNFASDDYVQASIIFTLRRLEEYLPNFSTA